MNDTLDSAILFTCFNTGVVRNAQCKIIAFIDEGARLVFLDGVLAGVPFMDHEHACDIIGAHFFPSK
jgi:hypothetical protein